MCFLCSIYNLNNVNKGNNENQSLVYIVNCNVVIFDLFSNCVFTAKVLVRMKNFVLCWFQLRDDVVPKTAGKKNLFLVL